ncbi:four helix bundle protein [Posidoniimonas corsicana]|uniref:four helix bundle protein n=1 Tax=Posidoniimonas corsicana TaxID=1938618 RepID=UPI0011B3AF98|nr:four helix bundle protein [Posidoniimonas corsicana]
MKSHEELEVWQKAIDLVDSAYGIAVGLPDQERFGLISQLQRAAVSVPANIAEGAGRDSTKEFLRHLSIARGSLAEVSTFFVIIERRGYASPETLNAARALLDQVGRLLSGLQRYLRKKLDKA